MEGAGTNWQTDDLIDFSDQGNQIQNFRMGVLNSKNGNMVQPLSILCLIALRDDVQKRPRLDLHAGIPMKVPKHGGVELQRQKFLELVLMCGGLKHESACISLSSADFLSEFTTLDTHLGITDDRKFLELVAESLSCDWPESKDKNESSVSEAGNSKIEGEFLASNAGNLKFEKLGSKIARLRLNIFGVCKYVAIEQTEETLKQSVRMVGQWRVIQTNFGSLIHLISQCQNLKKLHLDFVKELKTGGDLTPTNFLEIFSPEAGFLNRLLSIDSLKKIFEKLEELTVIGGDWSMIQPRFVTIDSPVLKFNCLSSLNLVNCTAHKEAWHQFLIMIKGILENLDVKNVTLMPDSRENCLLPFPLLKLRTLKIDQWSYSTPFFENLSQCPNLESIDINLNTFQNDDHSMLILKEIKAQLDLRIRFFGSCSLEKQIDAQGRFKLVQLFGNKIKEVQFSSCYDRPQFRGALEHLVGTCLDLRALDMKLEPTCHWGVLQALQRLKIINSVWTPLFQDQERASKLEKVHLYGHFDHGALMALFENATNLKSLDIGSCDGLFDDHLITWATRGARPEKIRISGCNNISDLGLVEIVKSSGDKLKEVVINCGNNVTDQTWRAVIENCRYLEKGNIPGHLGDLCRAKCWNGRVECKQW